MFWNKWTPWLRIATKTVCLYWLIVVIFIINMFLSIIPVTASCYTAPCVFIILAMPAWILSILFEIPTVLAWLLFIMIQSLTYFIIGTIIGIIYQKYRLNDS